MGQVSVTINNRPYLVACDDGEEDRLRELGAYIDKHVTELAQSVGQVGDARLLLMSGLLVADELAEALARVRDLEAELNDLHNGSQLEETLADFLERAAGRIDDMAARIDAN